MKKSDDISDVFGTIIIIVMLLLALSFYVKVGKNEDGFIYNNKITKEVNIKK